MFLKIEDSSINSQEKGNKISKNLPVHLIDVLLRSAGQPDQ